MKEKDLTAIEPVAKANAESEKNKIEAKGPLAPVWLDSNADARDGAGIVGAVAARKG